MSNDTVYIKIAQITETGAQDVFLKDIAEVHCKNKSVEAKVKAVKVTSFSDESRKASYIGSVMELMERLEAAGTSVQVDNIGETDFVIMYQPPGHPGKVFQWMKTLFVSAVAFFGAAFAIMTFNNDANVTDVFANIYSLVMGMESDGITALEVSYSVGLSLGILVFFNHFASWKITVDPTPIEVEMRLYEDNLNKTLIQNHERKESGIDVS